LHGKIKQLPILYVSDRLDRYMKCCICANSEKTRKIIED